MKAFPAAARMARPAVARKWGRHAGYRRLCSGSPPRQPLTASVRHSFFCFFLDCLFLSAPISRNGPTEGPEWCTPLALLPVYLFRLPIRALSTPTGSHSTQSPPVPLSSTLLSLQATVCLWILAATGGNPPPSKMEDHAQTVSEFLGEAPQHTVGINLLLPTLRFAFLHKPLSTLH